MEQPEYDLLGDNAVDVVSLIIIWYRFFTCLPVVIDEKDSTHDAYKPGLDLISKCSFK